MRIVKMYKYFRYFAYLFLRSLSVPLSVFPVLFFLCSLAYAGQLTATVPSGPSSYRTDEGLSNDEAVQGYIEKTLFYRPGRSSFQLVRSSTINRLNSTEKRLYTILKKLIQETAAGEHSTTVFTIPIKELYEDIALSAQDLGLTTLTYEDQISAAASLLFYEYTSISMAKVHRALLYDCPYDLYWYDKTQGISWVWKDHWGTEFHGLPCTLESDRLRILDYETGSFEITFTVALEYSADNRMGSVSFNTALGQAITDAASNIKKIINDNKDLSSFEKLKAYKDEICNLVDYNSLAVEDDDTPYGNPWQLVWIFDGDPDTKVVCEGYSKGFQYLCDLTWPEGSDVACVSVTGHMWSSTSSGGLHMWNIVSLHGTKYMVDVTNCDQGAIGYPDLLFLKGFNRIKYGVYQYEVGTRTIYYQYDSSTLSVFTDEELRLDDDLLGPDDGTFKTGTCSSSGSNIRWVLNPGSGVMRLSGAGRTADYPSGASPWADYRNLIKRVVIDKDITGIGMGAFRGCTNLISVDIRGNVSSIGDNAFSGCPELTVGGHGTVLLPSCTAFYLRKWVGEPNYINSSFTHDDMRDIGPREAGCTEPGYKHVMYCKACRLTFEYDEIPAKGHQEVKDPAVAATCTQKGLTEGSHCSACGSVFVSQNEVPALGHKAVKDADTVATCTKAGKTEGSHCSVCKAVLVPQKEIPATGHKEVRDAGVAATCTKAGKTEGSHCSACGTVLKVQETVPVKAHTLVRTKKKEATCTASGKEASWKCSSCGALFGDSEGRRAINAPAVIPACGHTVVIDPAIPATLSETGLTEGKHCSVCGTVLMARKTVPKLTSGSFTAKDGYRYEIYDDGTACLVKGRSSSVTVKIPDTITVGEKDIKVTSISDKVFYGNRKMKKLIIGSNVRMIGDKAFCSCSKLKTIKGGEKVAVIGADAFASCVALASVPEFPGLLSIGSRAFQNCVGLKAFTLGGKVKKISSCAFEGCGKLKNIRIKTKNLAIKNVGENAFMNIADKAVIKCPKKKLKKYRVILEKKGVPKTAVYS